MKIIVRSFRGFESQLLDVNILGDHIIYKDEMGCSAS